MLPGEMFKTGLFKMQFPLFPGLERVNGKVSQGTQKYSQKMIMDIICQEFFAIVCIT